MQLSTEMDVRKRTTNCVQTMCHKLCRVSTVFIYNKTKVQIKNVSLSRDVTAGDHYCIKFCTMRWIVYSLWAQKQNQIVSGCNFKSQKYF